MSAKYKKGNQSYKFRKLSLYLILYFLIVIFLFSINGKLDIDFGLGVITIFLFFLVLMVLLVFFSQFVLPVINTAQRLNAAKRLFHYILGNHGPAFFIENGELRERKLDHVKKGPGVVILDTASAAVLRTPVKFKGAIGPGIAFTENDDIIAGIVDLHIQTQSVGPRQEEDPFLPLQKNESKAAYEARILRKNETLAITRDGIQICINFTINFKLDSNPGDGNSSFGYNPQSVEKAIIGQSINLEKPDDNPDRLTSWEWLPKHLVMDIFREYISKYTLNDLFPLTRSEKNILDLVTSQIKLRLTQSSYITIDNYGNKTSETQLSKEFELLKNRGIRFLDIVITNLRLPQEVDDAIENRWRSSWLDVANRDRKFVEQEQAVQALEGQNQALMDYAYGASKHLGSFAQDDILNAKQLLVSLLQGNLDTISQNPELSSLLNNEYKDISDLIEWVGSQGDLS